jgi:hypothetical protein
MKRICLWSGPRNISTALMYSFAQRKDTKVIDEPLYGHYLEVTGVIHPGREEVIQSTNCDGNAVMQELINLESNSYDVLFIKQMSHHFQYLKNDFLTKTENIFLIRDPKEVLSSLTVQLPNATVRDTGLDIQWQLYQTLKSSGASPIVIDSRDLLINPEAILTLLCDHLSIKFSKKMLKWKAEPIKEDGIWSKYWYHTVHKSSGFIPYTAKPELPKTLLKLYNNCRPYYKNLLKNALSTKRS